VGWVRTIVLQKNWGGGQDDTYTNTPRLLALALGGQGDTKLTPTHRIYLRLHTKPMAYIDVDEKDIN